VPLDSIIEGFLSGILRVVWVVLWVAVEIIFEILIKGLGYTICRPFKKTDIDGSLCAFVGMVAWIILALLLLWVLI